MVLYMIGLGLGNQDDVTMRGYKIIQSADIIFLESYTSMLIGTTVEQLETMYSTKRPIVVADRTMVEQDSDIMIVQPAKTQTVVFLVAGDPVCATTHTDLWLRCKEQNVNVEYVHNASIMNAVGATGLQLYTFGQTVSIPYFTEEWKPMRSFYDKIKYNRAGNLHTLCLLDIKVKEPDYETMIRTGKTIYLPPRYMSIQEASEQLIETEQCMNENVYSIASTLCIACARMGHPTQQLIVAGTLTELAKYEQMGGPLHSLIICADILHDLEYDVIRYYLLPNSKYSYTSDEERRKNNSALCQTQEEQPGVDAKSVENPSR